MPEILEGFPEQEFTTGPGGPRAQRCFWVDSSSWAGALNRLRAEKNVFRGCLYEDHSGNIFDSFLICRHIRMHPKSGFASTSAGWWYACCDYEYPSVTRERPQTYPGGPPEYWQEFTEVYEPAEFDARGRRITNDADEFPNPLPTVPVVRETLVIEWHQYATDRFTLQSQKRFWFNRTNNASYLGYEPECLRCMPVIIEKVPVPPQSYGSPLSVFRCQARLEYRPPIETRDTNGQVIGTYPGWYIVFPNIGTRIRTPNLAKPYAKLTEPLEDGSGAMGPVTQPVLLAEGSQGQSRAPDGAPLNYKDYSPLASVDFTGLVTP